MNLTRMKRPGLLAGAIVLPVVMVVVLGVLSSAVVAGPEDVAATGKTLVEQPVRAAPAAAEGVSAQEGFVLRFDPVLESFETFTVTTEGGNPHSVDVVSNGTNLDVWFTEPAADKIGRLVYTATDDYVVHEYPVTPGGEPLNLVADGERGLVWFTERAGNRIGRLEIGSGTYSGFAVPTPDSRPSGIDLAPDGSVWFSEMGADQIGHLVVRTTSDFDLDEYEIPEFAGLPSESAPYGVYVENADRIWFAETARDQLVRFQPSTYPYDPEAAFAGAGRPQESGGYLYNLTFNPNNNLLWVSELLGNRVTFYFPGTLPGLQYPVPTPNSRPYDLDVDSAGNLWFSEQGGGKLGKLVPLGAGAGFTITDEYALPLVNARPEGVTVDAKDKVWLAASSWQNVYLPLLGKNFPPLPPPFGIQTYWPIDGTHGLQEMEDADTEWVRLILSWMRVEPSDTTPENFNWAAYDRWFSNLHAAGIRPVVTIQGNPGWAARYTGGPVYPEHMQDLLEFVGALVERYDGDGIDDAPGSPVVNHWEFYNEPDNGSVLLAEHDYGYWGHNGAGYADLLRQVWPVIKAANPKARVLNGGIAYERFEDAGEGPYVRRFMDDFLAAGGGRYIDIFNFHYYPNFAYRWAPYGQGVIGKTTFLRDRLRSYGVPVPLACTEIGTHNDPSSGGSNELQSRYVVQAFVRSMAADLRIVTWFALRDIVDGFPYPYGLLDIYFQPKPAYDAFDTLTAQLAGARYERRLTAVETGTAAIEGYVFSNDVQTIYVAWTNDGVTYVMRVEASAVEQVSKYGASHVVLDSADGAADGVVRIEVGPSPVYYRFEP